MTLSSPIVVVLVIGWLCLVGQMLAALRFARRPLPAAVRPAAVSVLKPLHGAEPGLYENLRSFVEQDYPAVQIVLGVNHPQDGALDAARALIRDFPGDDVALVVDRRIRGSNQKVANLENMLAAARHDTLVLADSDMRVNPRYLAAVAAPLADSRVGVVTCLYKGASTGGFWSDLGALQINFSFLTNALLGDALGIGRGCFGATIALRRATLRRIGGFARVRDELADDQRIGDAVRAQGLAVVLSPYLVEAQVWEPSLAALWRHELRWARTVRGIAPIGFAGSAATHPLAIALLAAIIAGFGSIAGILLAATCVLRWAAAGALARALGLPVRRLWLLPLRDVLSFAVFVASFFGRRVSWRDQNLHVEPNGRMTVVDGEKAL
ncbi:MAG TPA: bacteriohopanetetrol glucosamine biosynthesis glycosyltransferase HpnI [Stellaceae bacterium]|jgi:ceramide glucosyltransferase|nr:bacteriohopanetetrol glucosamine biosynthesis glycosyltransferase HpnI [Stellaceae bacterium]